MVCGMVSLRAHNKKNHPRVIRGRLLSFMYYNLSLPCLSKYDFVSLATIPLNAMSAIRLGIAMNPLKISAIVQTAFTVRKGPMRTASMYNYLNIVRTMLFFLPPNRYSRHLSA